MITSVSLNPSIDRTIGLEKLTVGGLNRVKNQTDVAAGKGVNVALAAAALGEESECIGFMYREGAQLFEERLRAGNVSSDFVWCAGAVRVNVKLFDQVKGEITEINSSGTAVDKEQLDAMRNLVRSHARNSDYMVLSGSMPPACPADFYSDLGKICAEENCRVLLDADGERLRSGLEAKPYLIKPNRYELELLTGRTLDTLDRLLEAGLDCVRQGVGVAAISMGGEGALITDGRSAFRTPGLKLEVKSTVAAGDSMIAGLAAGFRRGEGLEAAFRLGVAAASARCMTPPDEIISPDVCMQLSEKLHVEKIF